MEELTAIIEEGDRLSFDIKCLKNGGSYEGWNNRHG